MSAITPEGKVKRKIRDVLDKYKPHLWYFMPRGTTFGASGVPDFVCCVCGLFVGVEAKAGKGKPSPLQLAVMENIRVADGVTFVVYENDIGQLDESVGKLVRNSLDAKLGYVWRR